MIETVLRELENHALTSPSAEVCGFVYPDCYVPLTNRSTNPKRFEADPREVAAVLAHHGEPQSIFHTHPNGSLELSDGDRNSYYPNSTIIVGVIEDNKLKIRTHPRDAELK